VAVLFFTLSFGLVYYMNFRYGYMQAQVMGYPDSEVRERDYFYLITFSVWGLWVGVGLTALWLELAKALGTGRRAPRPSPVLALGLIPLFANWSYATRAGDYAARDFAYNLLQSVEPYGVLITNGDNDTFPLWYLQEVEGIRRDVTVIVAQGGMLTELGLDPWGVRHGLATKLEPRPSAALAQEGLVQGARRMAAHGSISSTRCGSTTTSTCIAASRTGSSGRTAPARTSPCSTTPWRSSSRMPQRRPAWARRS
jgi:hypothetical protein